MLMLGLLIMTVIVVTTPALIWVACWAFGIAFSWKLVLGVIAILLLIRFWVRAAAGLDE